MAQALEPVQQNGTINVETTQMTIRKRFTQSPLAAATTDEGLGLAGLQILNMMRGTYRRALPYFIRPALAIDVEKLLRERFKANPHMEWEAVEQLLLKGLIHHPVRRDWETTLTQVRADREGSFKNHHLPSSVYAYMAVPPPLRGTALLLIPAPQNQWL